MAEKKLKDGSKRIHLTVEDVSIMLRESLRYSRGFHGPMKFRPGNGRARGSYNVYVFPEDNEK